MAKIIYIMGSARSGSTLFGVLLGNNFSTLDVGELCDFPKLRGKPNGYGTDTVNFRFWEKVENNMSPINKDPNYSKLSTISQKIESPKRFFLNYFNLVPSKFVKEYKKFINDLFNSIFEITDKSVIIDSSKYPGRALALAKYLDKDIYIIYLVRNPKGVVDSFLKNSDNQGTKGFFGANFYFFMINLFSHLVCLKVKGKFIKVKYENLVSNPIVELEKIQSKFNIDLSQSIKMVEDNEPLKSEFTFNGNRMRLNKEIRIKTSYSYYNKSIKNMFIHFINGIWYT